VLKSFYLDAPTQYREFNQRRDTVDFNDLLEQAAMRLIEDAGLRSEIHRRYAHVLIMSTEIPAQSRFSFSNT
jgi:ATP-dependent exoDNAse (exonuclease V) beta subunit